MSPLNLNRLKQLAMEFRTAIERCDKRRLPFSFETFPTGSCGDATYLLGTFLMEQGIGTFRFVCGQRGARQADWHSHAWLEAEGVIVDITADQFPEMQEKVVVTRKSAWHATFAQESQRHTDYRQNDLYTSTTLKKAYRVIAEKLAPWNPTEVSP